MNDKIYVVYNEDAMLYDNYDWSETTYNVLDNYFTDENQAELYADYLNMTTNGNCHVKEVFNGDHIDCKSLVEECKSLVEEYKKRQIEKKLIRERNNRANDVDRYVFYKSIVDGKNLIEFKKYVDYIEDGMIDKY